MKWRPTPKSRLITALRRIGETWEACLMAELQPGDIFRAVDANGNTINPATHELDDDCVARVHDFPIRNDNNCNGSIFGAEGYGVPMELFRSIDDLKRRGLS